MSIRNGLRSERLIAKRYEEMGYSVTLEPSRSAIPFDLGNYRPDILATKAGENLLIEVKGPRSHTNSARLLEIAEEVHRHPGWRFLLVTVADGDLEETDSQTPTGMTLELLRERLREIDVLLKTPVSPSFFLPPLWMTYVAALKLLMAREALPGDNLTDASLINKAYSEGITSNAENEIGWRFLKLRNDVAHKIDTPVTAEQINELRKMVDVTIQRLELPIEQERISTTDIQTRRGLT